MPQPYVNGKAGNMLEGTEVRFLSTAVSVHMNRCFKYFSYDYANCVMSCF
jgi:hypothetical protein